MFLFLSAINSGNRESVKTDLGVEYLVNSLCFCVCPYVPIIRVIKVPDDGQTTVLLFIPFVLYVIKYYSTLCLSKMFFKLSLLLNLYTNSKDTVRPN